MSPNSVIVNVETTGTGHAWLSVGEHEDKTVYSYEPEDRRSISSKGILIVKTGTHAKFYEKGKKKETTVNSYVIKDVSDTDMINTMNAIIENATETTTAAEFNEEGNSTTKYTIEDYNFFSSIVLCLLQMH